LGLNSKPYNKRFSILAVPKWCLEMGLYYNLENRIC
jgi:hypothetical protein